MASLSYDEFEATKRFNRYNYLDLEDRYQEWPPSAETIEAFLEYYRGIIQRYEEAGEWPWASWRDIPVPESPPGEPLTWSVEERRRRLSFSSPRLQ